MKKLFCCLILFMTALLCFADEKFEKVKAAAEQGDAAAQLNLALMYYAGEGTLPDKTKAAYWVKQAYENGLDKAKEFWETYELWKYQE